MNVHTASNNMDAAPTKNAEKRATKSAQSLGTKFADFTVTIEANIVNELQAHAAQLPDDASIKAWLKGCNSRLDELKRDKSSTTRWAQVIRLYQVADANTVLELGIKKAVEAEKMVRAGVDAAEATKLAGKGITAKENREANAKPLKGKPRVDKALTDAIKKLAAVRDALGSSKAEKALAASIDSIIEEANA